jgi:hypothetical protein
VTRRLITLVCAAATVGVTACDAAEQKTGSKSATQARLPPQAPSIGNDRRYRPPSLGQRAARGGPVNGMRCTDRPRERTYGAHLELFANKKVVIVAPGIGVAPPRTRTGAYVDDGRCRYPLRTHEPTGVIEVANGERRPPTLGDLFDIWGQPLGRSRMVGFKGRVTAHVGGTRWRRNPRDIPLARHAQIVLQTGGYIRPHRTYNFPAGL